MFYGIIIRMYYTVHISFDTISWDEEVDLCADTLYETSLPIS